MYVRVNIKSFQAWMTFVPENTNPPNFPEKTKHSISTTIGSVTKLWLVEKTRVVEDDQDNNPSEQLNEKTISDISERMNVMFEIFLYLLVWSNANNEDGSIVCCTI